MKRLFIFFWIITNIITFTACSKNVSKDIENIDNGNKTNDNDFKIAMVTDIGGVYDNSFNQSAWEGMKRAKKELDVNIDYKESEGELNYYDSFKALMREENDLIWGVGFLTKDDLKKIADEYPYEKFALIDSTFGENNPSNLLAVTFKEHEAAFLVGYIAGKMTKEDKLGFIGGMDSEVIHRFHYGYMAGVKYANPDCKIISKYANTFINPNRGKEIALDIYSKGVDIIFHASGETGNGMIEAAKEVDKYAIGVDKDQNKEAPNHVITSAMKRVDNAIFNTIKCFKQGYWHGGATIEYGLAEEGVGIAPSSNKHVPKDILNEVEKIKLNIITGNISVPTNNEEYIKFHKQLQTSNRNK